MMHRTHDNSALRFKINYEASHDVTVTQTEWPHQYRSVHTMIIVRTDVAVLSAGIELGQTCIAHLPHCRELSLSIVSGHPGCCPSYRAVS